MSEPVKRSGLLKNRPSESDIERRELFDAIKNTREQLRLARISFNNASEPELIDASIYEINSLQAKYSYLLRKIKEQEYASHETFKEVREYDL
jgi:hypothetical protein